MRSQAAVSTAAIEAKEDAVFRGAPVRSFGSAIHTNVISWDPEQKVIVFGVHLGVCHDGDGTPSEGVNVKNGNMHRGARRETGEARAPRDRVVLLESTVIHDR